MVFSSLLFLFRFLPIVLAIYYLSPKKLRNTVLFLSSLFFYAWGEPVYILLMVFSTLTDYIHGRLAERFLAKKQVSQARATVFSSVAINLGLLFFFKYSAFFTDFFCRITGISIPIPQLSLPIGISFYTFQTMSYTIDIYRGQAKPQKNFIDFGTYVALFPQLIAGPIVRYQTIAHQLTKRQENLCSFASGVHRFLIGLGKKVLLANTIGVLWSTIQATPFGQLPTFTAWMGIFAFAFQIYFDFSGYSDMAIGMGRMFGFYFLENFHDPYLSESITDFWRRWHISLGQWFREYVYIPLGGNRKGRLLQFRNIFIVWLLTGFWHGASWNFLLWGLWFAVLLTAEKQFLLLWLKKLPTVLRHIYALVAISIGWVIFSFDSLKQGFGYLKILFGQASVPLWNTESIYLLSNYGILMAICLIGCTHVPKMLGTVYLNKISGERKPAIIQNLFYVIIFILCICCLVDASYNPFLYFRF